MSRNKLKYGGKCRRKALFGAEAAVTASAILAAAGMTTAATAAAAKQQSKSIESSAKQQALSITEQNKNNNNLQKESIEFTRQQNQENRQQQQDIQTTLQMLAGQQNVNDRMEANKVQVKYGGKPKRRKLKNTISYKNDVPFKVTDGGGVIPIQTDAYGYGLYELYGNDHEHYHKAPGGKNKTGVGIKFEDGSVVEGEGNQNTNQGELMYVTPDDAIFISKHNINGFNPAKAVNNGVHPVEAYNIQEILKNTKGLNDDGSRRHASLGGFTVLDNIANITQFPSNNTAAVAGGTAYAVNNNKITAKNGTRISIKHIPRKKAYLGDFRPFRYGIGSPSLTDFGTTPIGNPNRVGTTPVYSGNFTNLSTNTTGSTSPSIRGNNTLNGYQGAMISSGANIGGALITTFGNMYASRKLGKAYTRAGNILADAYSQMKGIDLNEIKREDYEAPHTMAVIRGANTNINPQLERIRRNANAERREINRGTISSAARQQKLAGVNDRMLQRVGEQYAYKQNADEQIKQGNAERITQTSQANADRDVQARQNWTNQRLSLLQYNNDIENAKIAGIGQARADAISQRGLTRANAIQSSLNSIGNAFGASGQAFSSAYDAIRKERNDFNSTFVGLGDADKIDAAILRAEQTGDLSYINTLLDKHRSLKDTVSKSHFNKLMEWVKRNNVKLS